MAANEIPLSPYVINVSVQQAQAGIGKYNTSNVGLFSREEVDPSFGSAGYKLFTSPTEVATYFGSDSDTYKMAVALFSQKPNILQGDGYLCIMPYADTPAVTAVQLVSFSTVPASGSYKLKYGLLETTSLLFSDNAAAVQSALRALAGLTTVTVTGDTTAGFVVTFVGVSGPATLLVSDENSLQDSTPINVDVTATTTTAGTILSTETLKEALLRTKDLVQYFGVCTAEITSEADMLDAAALIQTLNKIAFFVSRDAADVEPAGMLDLLTTGGFTQSRGLYYGGATDTLALTMMASYIGRALSVNFEGSNTTITMHLKDLSGVQPDPSMTETLLNKCQDAGADVYISLQGVPKVFTSGENKFFDQVYNQQWIVGAIQVAGFNYLATSGTKIPQTENGMIGLKGAYRQACLQAVTNGYAAPGAWTSADTFGNQDNFLANIAQMGFYIYSAPISQQSAASRAAREAPLVQIALKEAGAVQSSDVIININP